MHTMAAIIRPFACPRTWLLLKSDTAIQRYSDTEPEPGTGTWNRA
jgi:hypothetical protein